MGLLLNNGYCDKRSSLTDCDVWRWHGKLITSSAGSSCDPIRNKTNTSSLLTVAQNQQIHVSATLLSLLSSVFFFATILAFSIVFQSEDNYMSGIY